MITGLMVLAILAVAASCSSNSATVGSANEPVLGAARLPTEEVSFAADVLSILSDGCRPCHFEGGKMYERPPFDRPETIGELGERLFTRLENEREREVIRSFLADSSSRP